MTLSRLDRQSKAVVQLLQTLTHRQLVDVLQAIDATPNASTTSPRHRGKPCTICGLIYPEHMRRWADDHPFERPKGEQTPAAEEETA